MRADIIKEMLSYSKPGTTEFVNLCGDIIIRVKELMQEKGITQQDLAEKMGKKAPEVSKWLSGNHNFTLRSIARLEAELGEKILVVPGFEHLDKKATDNNPAITTVKVKAKKQAPHIF